MSTFDDIFNFVDSPIIAPAPEPQKVGDEWRKSEGWLRIKGITSKEIYTPCGVMERSPLVAKTSANLPNKPEVKSTGKDAPLGFGKYRDKSPVWIIENDPRYSSWMQQNVDKYAALLKKYNLD